jgi:hypothetical protein
LGGRFLLVYLGIHRPGGHLSSGKPANLKDS